MSDSFNGLGVDLGNLARLASAKSRSISAENPTGAKGEGGKAVTGTGARAAEGLGVGWKVSPYIDIEPHSTAELARIDGPGCIQHMWMTVDPTIHTPIDVTLSGLLRDGLTIALEG